MPEIDELQSKDADKKAIAEILESQSKLLAESYDKAMAYTNLLVALGYACFFGLWQITKDVMSVKQIFFSAFLMLISAIVFVLFEVVKMYFVSKQNHEFNRIITDQTITGTLPSLQKAFVDYRNKIHEHHLRWAYWWHFTWIVSVLFGIGAVAVLLWAFVSGLLKSYC